MACPVFVHVTSDGKFWASCDIHYTPPGTILTTMRINPGISSQQIGTLSGNSGSYSISGGTGKWGKELT